MLRWAGTIVQLPVAAALRHDHTLIAAAAVSVDCLPRVVPATISATGAIGPPIVEGPTPMRTGDPTITSPRPADTQSIMCTPRLHSTPHIDEAAITAIADKTPDEPSEMLGLAGSGTARCTPMHVRASPIHLPPHTGMAILIVTVSQTATGRALHRVRRATSRAMPSQKAVGWRSKTLRRQIHARRPCTIIAHLWARIVVADPLRCRSS